MARVLAGSDIVVAIDNIVAALAVDGTCPGRSAALAVAAADAAHALNSIVDRWCVRWIPTAFQPSDEASRGADIPLEKALVAPEHFAKLPSGRPFSGETHFGFHSNK